MLDGWAADLDSVEVRSLPAPAPESLPGVLGEEAINRLRAARAEAEPTPEEMARKAYPLGQSGRDGDWARRGFAEGVSAARAHRGSEKAALAVALGAARTEAAALRADLAAVTREADRLRHGQDIEGDHVCPGEIEADKLRGRMAEARKHLTAAKRQLYFFGVARPHLHDAALEIESALAALTREPVESPRPPAPDGICSRCGMALVCSKACWEAPAAESPEPTPEEMAAELYPPTICQEAWAVVQRDRAFNIAVEAIRAERARRTTSLVEPAADGDPFGREAATERGTGRRT